MSDALSALPRELLQHILDQLRPCDLVSTCPTSRLLAAATTDDQLWRGQLRRAVDTAVVGLSSPSMMPTQRHQLCAATHDKMTVAGRAARNAKEAYFLGLQWLATAAVEAVAMANPSRILLSLDRRAYDVTEFADKHPGGAQNMRDYSGMDAGEVFAVFAHSPTAHDMMRKEFLRFDAVACVGRHGAPRCARSAAGGTVDWSFTREALAFAREAAGLPAGESDCALPPWRRAEIVSTHPTSPAPLGALGSALLLGGDGVAVVGAGHDEAWPARSVCSLVTTALLAAGASAVFTGLDAADQMSTTASGVAWPISPISLVTMTAMLAAGVTRRRVS